METFTKVKYNLILNIESEFVNESDITESTAGWNFRFKKWNANLKDINRGWTKHGGIIKYVLQINVEYTNWESCQNIKQTGIKHEKAYAMLFEEFCPGQM